MWRNESICCLVFWRECWGVCIRRKYIWSRGVRVVRCRCPWWQTVAVLVSLCRCWRSSIRVWSCHRAVWCVCRGWVLVRGWWWWVEGRWWWSCWIVMIIIKYSYNSIRFRLIREVSCINLERLLIFCLPVAMREIPLGWRIFLILLWKGFKEEVLFFLHDLISCHFWVYFANNWWLISSVHFLLIYFIAVPFLLLLFGCFLLISCRKMVLLRLLL